MNYHNINMLNFSKRYAHLIGILFYEFLKINIKWGVQIFSSYYSSKQFYYYVIN